MKLRVLFAVIFAILLQSNATAAPIAEVKSKFELTYSGNEQVSDVLLNKTSISLIGTTEAATSTWISGNLAGGSDGFVTTFSNTGLPLWNLRLGGLS